MIKPFFNFRCAAYCIKAAGLLFLSCIFILALFFQKSYGEEAPLGVPAGDEAQGRLITLPQGINIVLKDSRLLKISLFDKDIALEDSFIARSAILLCILPLVFFLKRAKSTDAAVAAH